jgi:uncharacterized protein YggE
MSSLKVCTLVAVIAIAIQAQTSQAIPAVRGIGQAAVSGTPDKATVDLAVDTRATTAQDAASQNATITASVLMALQKVLSPGDNIRTLNYSLAPVYSYPSGGSAGTLTGYSVSNTVEVTTGSLALVGKLLDTGTQAGATRVQGLTFGLKDPEPLRQQALQQATIQARAHAATMVAASGLRLGNVITIVEGTTTSPVAGTVAGAADSTTTPIMAGSVTATATVTMDFQLLQ